MPKPNPTRADLVAYMRLKIRQGHNPRSGGGGRQRGALMIRGDELSAVAETLKTFGPEGEAEARGLFQILPKYEAIERLVLKRPEAEGDALLKILVLSDWKLENTSPGLDPTSAGSVL